ncbi:MAG: M23 family metallopeptidase [Myxococcota bacterium]
MRVARLVPALLAVLAAVVVVSPPSAQADRNGSGTETVSDWTCHERVCLRTRRRGEFVTFQIQSRRKTATWVLVEPTVLDNLRPLQPTPFAVRAEPGGRYDAGVAAIVDRRRAHAHETRFTMLRGNPNAVHDDARHYRMPFGGSTRRGISQGYNGKFSHKGLGAYALDFPMPWGTPILASRGGVIVEVINDMVASGTRTGEFEKDNRVVIEHRDGTFAIYAHLRHGGPARVGQHVRQGDLIGLSGDTGFSTGPHLHFEVFKFRRDGKRQTIPVKFWNGTARGYTPVAGLVYKPGCPSSGGSQCLPGELAFESGSTGPAPAAPAPRTRQTSKRADDGACHCANGAVLHVDLPCNLVCGR